MIPDGTQLGPYKILYHLGAGGMGEVYRARDLRLDRDVAVKVLPEQSAGAPHQLARFEREAKAVAALAHPNVLAIHDFATEQGIRFAVMELLEGETLRQRITRAALPWRKALEIGVAITEGLAAAHGKGIVHRDLKPENIFLTSDGRVKILDFGLARADPEAVPQADTGPYLPGLTEQGTVMGTFGYMSPEQVRGESVDARSDLFSFGCVLYEMLTRRQAFRRKTRADTIAATLHEDPPELSAAAMEAPLGVEQLIRRSLEKNPEERFQSARDLAFNLRALLTHPSTRSEPPSPRSRRRLTLWAAAIVLLLGAGIAVWYAISPPQGAPNLGESARMTGPKSIAVLPILNETGDKENDLSDESTELLIGQLQVRGLVIKPFAAVSRYKQDKRGWQELGRNLQVNYVLIGRLRPGEKISIELLDVAGDSLVLGKYSLPVSGEVYGSIAREVLAKLDVPLTPEERQRLAKPLTGSREALKLYLMGQQEFKQEKRENTDKAIQYYQRAQTLDPGFSLPYLGLAYAYYWQSGHFAAPNEAMPKAKAAALQALDRDGTLGEAHALLGFITPLPPRRLLMRR